MSIVLMKVLEAAPMRYDKGIQILTLGRYKRALADVAEMIQPRHRVLDIGCGTGVLATMLAQRGAHVVGIDISPDMLSVARDRVEKLQLTDSLDLREMGAAELDSAFPMKNFDVIVSSLTFSELSDEEIRFTLSQCKRLLKPNGRLAITDEVVPDSLPSRMLGSIVRAPLSLVTFLIIQSTSRRTTGLQRRITEAGFRVEYVWNYLFGTLQTVVADKVHSL